MDITAYQCAFSAATLLLICQKEGVCPPKVDVRRNARGVLSAGFLRTSTSLIRKDRNSVDPGSKPVVRILTQKVRKLNLGVIKLTAATAKVPYPCMDSTYDMLRVLRAARALLDLSHADVASLAKVSRAMIIRIEKGDGRGVSLETLEKVRTAFERKGVEFLPSTADRGPAIAERKAKLKTP